MVKYRLFNQLIAGVLWLLLGAGCQKDPPEPDYTCKRGCCIDDEVFFVEKLEAEPMDKTSSITMVLKSRGVEESVLVCLFQPKNSVFESSSPTYERQFPLSTSPTPPYRFRVWGALYRDRGIGFTGIPMYWVKFDRVEKIQ